MPPTSLMIDRINGPSVFSERSTTDTERTVAPIHQVVDLATGPERTNLHGDATLLAERPALDGSWKPPAVQQTKRAGADFGERPANIST